MKYLILALCLLTFNLKSQVIERPSRVSEAVLAATTTGAHFYSIKPFKVSKQAADGSQTLIVNKSVVSKVLKTRPQNIKLTVPKNSREDIVLKLIRVELLTDDFSVKTSDSTVPYIPGVYYRGVVDSTNSVAAISFFKDEVVGSFVYEGGNKSLQALPSDTLILLTNDTLPISACDSDKLDEVDKPQYLAAGINPANCVRMYLECDYALQQNKGGVTNTVNWITAVYNNVATLYANESINTTISQVYVWTTPDSYSKINSVIALNQFKALRPTYNGDLAHLAALGGVNLGGVAWVGGLCSGYGYGYSNIQASFSNVPTYSWTIQVITHEIGHNLGSQHTQSCSWIGGAIDGCYTQEGNCVKGPLPPPGGKGSIMSYCHLTQYGISFAIGFGQQPGDKIRSEVYSAACLSTCGGCGVPTGISVSNITANSAAASWIAISGATAYSFEYKTNSATNWSVVNTSSNTYNLAGLAANTVYNTRVKTVCGVNSSAYTAVVNFTTTSSICTVPSNFVISDITQNSAKASWATVVGAPNYIFEFKANSSTTWQTVSTELNYFVMPGTYPAFLPNTIYNARVRAGCSSFGPIVNFTTLNTQASYCPSKGGSVLYEYLKLIQFGTINRSSGKDNGFYDGTAIKTDVVRGSTYQLKYQAGSTGYSGTLYYKAWIDYNQDKDFDDPGELVMTNSTTSLSVLTSNIIIPANATLGNTQFRIIMKYGGAPTACGNFSYGECEVYTVNIK